VVLDVSAREATYVLMSVRRWCPGDARSPLRGAQRTRRGGMRARLRRSSAGIGDPRGCGGKTGVALRFARSGHRALEEDPRAELILFLVGLGAAEVGSGAEMISTVRLNSILNVGSCMASFSTRRPIRFCSALKACGCMRVGAPRTHPLGALFLSGVFTNTTCN
jgi:hypothetical protein